jgi:hypothetical protein
VTFTGHQHLSCLAEEIDMACLCYRNLGSCAAGSACACKNGRFAYQRYKGPSVSCFGPNHPIANKLREFSKEAPK